MAPDKSDKKAGRPLGPTGDAVRMNIRRIRDAQGISGAELSARLAAMDRPIPPLGIQRIEAGSRRVDVDDLMAIAVALDVPPISLLAPLDVADPDTDVEVTGVKAPISSALVWSWLTAQKPLNHELDIKVFLEFSERAYPTWRQKQVIQGIHEMVELNHLEAAIKAGGDQAVAAQARKDALIAQWKKEQSDGDDQ